MITIFNSLLLVFATEMGDKTQLLAFVLATRFKKPWTVLLGIFIATILNHYFASALGGVAASYIPEHILKIILATLFFGFAIWVLIPDKDEDVDNKHKYGALLTTIILFFFAEMGDKTQLSTVALAAKYQETINVTIGTTLGMLLANAPAVFFGEKIKKYVPMKLIHIGASILYILFGLVVLFK